MRSVVQRVERAEVRINGRRFSGIEKGLLVFLGIEKGDGESDADYLSDKIINLRIFEDKEGKMNLSVLDIKGAMLVISQFTLLADCRKGRRPSFSGAESPDTARGLYNRFLARAKERVTQVAQGEFQALMAVELVNDGPVTMLLDSRRDL